MFERDDHVKVEWQGKTYYGFVQMADTEKVGVFVYSTKTQMYTRGIVPVDAVTACEWELVDAVPQEI